MWLTISRVCTKHFFKIIPNLVHISLMLQTIRQALFGKTEETTEGTVASPLPSQSPDAEEESDDDEEELIQFMQEYGKDYGYDRALDSIREKEFPHMKGEGTISQFIPPPPPTLKCILIRSCRQHLS